MKNEIFKVNLNWWSEKFFRRTHTWKFFQNIFYIMGENVFLYHIWLWVTTNKWLKIVICDILDVFLYTKCQYSENLEYLIFWGKMKKTSYEIFVLEMFYIVKKHEEICVRSSLIPLDTPQPIIEMYCKVQVNNFSTQLPQNLIFQNTQR